MSKMLPCTVEVDSKNIFEPNRTINTSIICLAGLEREEYFEDQSPKAYILDKPIELFLQNLSNWSQSG